MSQQFIGFRIHCRFVNEFTFHRFSAEIDVFRDGHVRHKHELLVDNRYAVFLRIEHAADIDFLTVDVNLAFIRFDDSSQNFYKRRFTGAVFADQRVHFPRTQFEIDTVQRINARKAFMDVFHLKQ